MLEVYPLRLSGSLYTNSTVVVGTTYKWLLSRLFKVLFKRWNKEQRTCTGITSSRCGSSLEGTNK